MIRAKIRAAKVKIKSLFIKVEKKGNVYLASFFGQKWHINYPNKSLCIWALEFMDTHIRFPELITGDEIIVEAGACSGEYTIPIAKKLTKGGGKIYAFEVEPLSYESLLKNIKLYNLENIVTPVNMALHHTDNEKLLFKDIPNTMAGGSLYYGTKKYIGETVTLDTFCRINNINKIDILKLTVNGHEPEILRGGQNILNNVHYILVQSNRCDEIIRLCNKKFKVIKNKIENKKENVRVLLLENNKWEK